MTPQRAEGDELRILCVSPYALSVPGGVQNQVLGLARALSAQAVHVQIVAPGDLSEIAAIDGVAMTSVGRQLTIPVNGSRAPITLTPTAATTTARALRAFRPDVVHVHEPFVPVPALSALFSTSRPIVGTFHRSGDNLAYRASRPIALLAMRQIAVPIAVSEAARDTLGHVLGKVQEMSILANAVDVERFAGPRAKPPDRPIIVFVGRHERRKGLEVLLRAVAKIDLDLELWVIGDGPHSASLRAQFAHDERVVWWGRVSDDEVAERLRAATLFVAPSLGGESFGVVLLEAMAAGTPVVASDLAGYRLAGGDAVQYVTPGDADALRGAIEVVLSSPRRSEDLVSKGSARAAAHSFSALASSYLDIYRDLAARSR